MRDKCKRKHKCETNVNLEQYSSLGQSCCCSEHRAQEIVRNFPGEQKLPSPCKPICSLARASVFVNIFKLQPHILNTIRMQSNKTLKHSPKTPLNHNQTISVKKVEIPKRVGESVIWEKFPKIP